MIFSLLINVVCATDDINNTNSENVLSAPNNEHDLYVDGSSNNTIENGNIKTPYKTITENELNEAPNNTNFHVSSGKYYLNPISLNNNVSIIGENQNTVFIANTTDGIFNISVNSRLNLINITIQDYYSDTTAIINNRGTLKIEESVFKNNIRTTTGLQSCVIYNYANLTINNSEFRNNSGTYGANLFNNNANAIITNSLFIDTHSTSVGGAIYTIRSNMTVENSTFALNTGVSGAAIYNAFGKLTVNNTLFNYNNAETFFGGAIYNTGITQVTYSDFIQNNAKYSGGAITNTNNFTAINCTFEGNSAGTSGGAIENIAWTETENGNLTLINSSFIENSATINGGAIVNLNSTTVPNNYGTITARNTLFRLNSAGNIGGAIANDHYINLEYNVFVDNDALSDKTIYSPENLIKSADNNWWGENNPNWKKLGITPNKWIIMNFTNTSSLINDMETKLFVSLNTLNTGEKINSEIPSRTVIYLLSNSTFYDNNQVIFTNVTNTVIPRSDEVTAMIDNQRIILNPQDSNITYKLINKNQTIEINVNLPENINGKASFKIDGKTIITNQRIKNGKLVYDYDIPTSWSKNNYTLSTVLITSTGESLRKNMTITLPKRAVTTSIKINNNTRIEAGTTIKIIATIKMNNIAVNSGKVSFKINQKTIQSNVKVVNGQAIIEYVIPETFSPKKYNINIVYSGDSNKQSNRKNTTLTVLKHDVHPTVDSLNLMADAEVSVFIGLVDSNDNYVTYGKICYKINGITMENNVILDDGMFILTYTTPKLKTGSSISKTLTIVMQENSFYNSMVYDIPIKIEN